MSISNTNRKAGPFTGNGSASSFPFYFKVFEAVDLFVVLFNVATNGESVLVLTADYTVSLNANQDANPGGTVTLTSGALASGYTLTITSSVENLQPVNLTNQGGFYPDVIEDSLDRATIQIQQMSETLGRALTIPLSATANTELPPPQAGKTFAWNTTGTALENIDLGGAVSSAGIYVTQTFSGDGTTVDFTLSSSPTLLGNVEVFISGVRQKPTTDYSLSSFNSTLTFTSAPFAGTNNIFVRWASVLSPYEILAGTITPSKIEAGGPKWSSTVLTNSLAFGTNANPNYATTQGNIGFGSLTLNNTTSGQDNIAIGYSAGWTNASNTISIGTNANYGNVSSLGDSNIAIGTSAGYDCSTGQQNIAIGYAAYGGDGTNVQTGSKNTCIGPSAGVLLTSQSNTVVIGGYDGNACNNNAVVLSDGVGNIVAQHTGSTPKRWVFNSGASNLAALTLDENLNVIASNSLFGYTSPVNVTQGTSRSTNISANVRNGYITLFTAAGGAGAWTTITFTNSYIAATDIVCITQKSGTDKYQIFVTNTSAGSCKITFATIASGNTTEQPVFNFAIIKNS